MQTIANSSGIFNRHFPLRTGAQRTIASEVIASIRLATRLENIIAERIPLRRSGRALVGSCLWHKSRSGRSFVVYPDQQTWRCWACAVGGDVFGFLMRWGDVSFPSAVRLAAKIAGVKIDGNDLSEDIEEKVSARTELGQLEQQIAEALDAEYRRIARELDRVNRVRFRAAFRLEELSAGAVSCFTNEEAFCWSALACVAAALPRLDAEYCLLAFGQSVDRERFVLADAEERTAIIDELLYEGVVRGDQDYLWEVPVQ